MGLTRKVIFGRGTLQLGRVGEPRALVLFLLDTATTHSIVPGDWFRHTLRVWPFHSGFDSEHRVDIANLVRDAIRIG